MDDSDERLMLLVCAIAFWFVGGGLAAAMYFKIHAVVNLLFVIAFFNVALIVSYGSEHVEGLDRAKWFWCPLTLLFPYLVPFILYFLPESEDGPLGMEWIFEKLDWDIDWDEDTSAAIFGFICLGLGLVGIGWLLITYAGLSYQWATISVIGGVVVMLLLAYFFNPDGGEEYSGGGMPANSLWRCPNCSTVLQKGNMELMEALGHASVVGVATCGSCGAQYSQRDVYDGRYDL